MRFGLCRVTGRHDWLNKQMWGQMVNTICHCVRPLLSHDLEDFIVIAWKQHFHQVSSPLATLAHLIGIRLTSWDWPLTFNNYSSYLYVLRACNATTKSEGGRWKCRTRKCRTWKWRTKLQGWKMQDLKTQDRLWIRRTVDVSYNEQHYSDNHCEYGASVPRVQTLLRPWTVAARYAEAPYAWCCVCTNKVPANNFCENLACNLTSNVMLCAILWTDVYTHTVASVL